MVHLRVGTPDRIDWRNFLRIAAPIGGLVGILGLLVPLSWLVLFPGSVFVVIHLYARRRPESLKTAQGVKMGIVIGLLTFMVLGVYIVGNAVHDPVAYRQAVESALKEAAARNPNPDAARVAELLSSTAGVVIFIAMLMIVLMGFTIAVGAACGALAASFRRAKVP